MLLLLFLVLLIQFSTFWIFEPLTSLLEYVVAIKLLPIISILGLIWLFSVKKIEQN
jgi:hypothetical protein